MTREEAINHLKTVAKSAIDSGYDGAVVDAVDMAIKALEQEPCEDAISRADAIKAITTMCEEYTPTKSTYHPHIDFVVEELNKLPSVQPQPKTGHWIKTKEQDNAEPLILWKCSECLTVQRLKTNYCPNCGAKMIEPQESEVEE